MRKPSSNVPSNVIPFRPESTVPPDPRPSKGAHPQPIERVKASAEKRRFLNCTRRDLWTMFLAGASEYSLTERMGGRSQGVCRIDIEAAIRDTAREERERLLAAERQLRVAQRYAA